MTFHPGFQIKAAADFLTAARVPPSLESQTFGLWEIWRQWDMTILSRHTLATLHKEHGETVMEDSDRELSKHLPIWLTARGRVLVTGLGLGCVVRGLLASPKVDHVDVIEINPQIIRIVGAEFEHEPRVMIHCADALQIDLEDFPRWNFAWHDLWTDRAAGEPHTQCLHMRLFCHYQDHVGRQGAWAFPRHIARLMPWHPINAPKRKEKYRGTIIERIGDQGDR